MKSRNSSRTTASQRTTSRNLTNAFLRRASFVTERMLFSMIARATNQEPHVLPLSDQEQLETTSRPDQWPVRTSQAPQSCQEPVEERMQPPLRTSLSIPTAGGLVPKAPRQKCIPRLRRKTSGPPSRNSTPCFTTRSKSRPSCATVNASASSRKNWTNSLRRRTRESVPKLRSVGSTRTSKNSTLSSLRRRKSKRLPSSRSASCKRS